MHVEPRNECSAKGSPSAPTRELTSHFTFARRKRIIRTRRISQPTHVRRNILKPSSVLDLKRAAVREAASRFRTANPRVFGSALHGTDSEGSDLDLLVDALPGTTMFDLGGLQIELEELLGVRVDLLTPADLPLNIRVKVLAEAQPV